MYEGRYLAVIIAAGGAGTRFGAETNETIPKQFLNIDGKSMIMTAAEPFLRCGCADEIVFVVTMDYTGHTCQLVERELGGIWTNDGSSEQSLTVSSGGKDVFVRVIHGGQDRAASVRAGLKAITEKAKAGGLVLIHDAARPYITGDLISQVLKAAHEHGAAVPATPVSDTVYACDEDGFAAGIPDRKRLRRAQTPQGFDFDLIDRVHGYAFEEGLYLTDDGTPVFTYGGRVALVEGDLLNTKVTLPGDIPGQTPRLDEGTGLRVGIGFDAHRFEDGRALVLGGETIPFEKGLAGHSDADVLTHALMDAILGALHEGDIGKLFPDTDPALAGISSMALLAEVVSLMDKRGYEIENTDLTLVAERPRMADHRESIERRLAEVLGTAPENVSLKATTTERLGFTGREEGIAAEAVVLIKTKQLLKGGRE